MPPAHDHHHAPRPAGASAAEPIRPELVTDPVCGMRIDPRTARGGSVQHAGASYYFCNPGCRLLATFFPSLLPRSMWHQDAPPVYYEA